MLPATSQGLYRRIRKRLPPQLCMRVGLMGTNCQCGVEQEHALLCPPRQITAVGYRGTKVVLYLFEDIL